MSLVFVKGVWLKPAWTSEPKLRRLRTSRDSRSRRKPVNRQARLALWVRVEILRLFGIGFSAVNGKATNPRSERRNLVPCLACSVGSAGRWAVDFTSAFVVDSREAWQVFSRKSAGFIRRPARRTVRSLARLKRSGAEVLIGGV